MKLINNKYSTLRALEKFLKTTISRPVTSCRTGQDRTQDRNFCPVRITVSDIIIVILNNKEQFKLNK